MSTPDLDEEEKQNRKKMMVEWRNKKRFSNIFMFVASIFEIVETLILMLVAFILVSFVLIKICNPDSMAVQIIYQGLSVVIFVGGLIGGFFIYKAVIRWVITKFDLKDKLTDEILFHYVKKSDEEAKEELKK